jgi:hypothetical protein
MRKVIERCTKIFSGDVTGYLEKDIADKPTRRTVVTQQFRLKSDKKKLAESIHQLFLLHPVTGNPVRQQSWKLKQNRGLSFTSLS